MSTLLKAFFQMPLTYILLLQTATVITTIYAYMSHLLPILVAVYGIIFTLYLNAHNINKLVMLSFTIMVSFVALISINHQYQQYSSNQALLHHPVTVEGTITHITHANLIKEQSTIYIQTHKIKDKGHIITKPTTITVFCPTPTISHLQINQVVTIKHITLSQPKQHSEYERYLIKENIWATAHSKGEAIKATKDQPLSILQKTQISLNEVYGTTSLLFQPLFLGVKEKNKQNIQRQHQSTYWGIAHHMARSGAHLAILFAFLTLVLHYSSRSYILKYFTCLIVLLGYASVTQLSVSFTRALLMFTLSLTCKMLNKPPSTLHILTLTTILTLLYNPMQLFFLDFQLSFGVTYIIVWLFNVKKDQTLAIKEPFLVRS